jgi:hypothetical protein
MEEKNNKKISGKNSELEMKKEKGKETTARITDMSQSKAAKMVGIGLIIMLFLGLFGMSLYMVLIVPGDEATSINNIETNLLQFRLGIFSYLIILILDVIVAVGLYVVLKPVNKNLALLQMWFRLIYTAIAGISLLVLVLLYINEYSYTQLIAYAFFISHIFVLGYLVFKSGFIPRSLGVILMIASFGYVILLYGEFLLPQKWLEVLLLIFMPLAVIAEISLGIWLLVKGRKLPEMKNQDEVHMEDTEAKTEVMLS